MNNPPRKSPAKKSPAKKSLTKKSPVDKKSSAKKKAAFPAGMEAAMLQFQQLMAAGDLIAQDDLDALLISLQGPLVGDGLTDPEAEARDEAQQLAFDAMEAETDAQAIKLANRALKLYPDCVDALVVLAEIESESPRKLIEALKKAVAAGERSLGATYIRQNTGHFWGLLETRPYMRALGQLANQLQAQGIKLDAIQLYEKMLTLNPNDNQGVRDPLLGLYLATNNLQAARRVLKDFEEDASAAFAWARVLERVLSADLPAAEAALSLARSANRFVELYLTGQRKLSGELPEMYSPGSDEEAILVLENLASAWADQKQAALWLIDQLAKESPQAPTRKLKLAH